MAFVMRFGQRVFCKLQMQDERAMRPRRADGSGSDSSSGRMACLSGSIRVGSNI